MTISISKLYDLLANKTGRDSAETLIAYTKKKIKEEFTDQSKILATKEGIIKGIAYVRTMLPVGYRSHYTDVYFLDR